MENLVKESKKYGLYTNRLIGQDYPKIEVVNVLEILDGARMKLPVALDVVKAATLVRKSNQNTLDLE